MVSSGGATQSVRIPALNAGASLLIEGGWTSPWNGDHNPAACPATLDANRGGHVVYVSSGAGSVTLKDLTLKNGYASDGGGGVYADPVSLSLSNVLISDSDTSSGHGPGGGIYSFFGSLTLDRVTLEGNVAWNGGGLYKYGGSVTMTNVTVSGNTARGGGGGGVQLYGCTAADLEYVTIVGNNALYGDGLGAENTAPSVSASIIAANDGEDVYIYPDWIPVTGGGGNVIGSGNTSGFSQPSDQTGVSDPGLGAFDGWVYPLVAGSPAIETIACASMGIDHNQHGSPRPGGATDTAMRGPTRRRASRPGVEPGRRRSGERD